MDMSLSSDFFQPVSGMVLPRFAGVPTFMRLPHAPVGDPRADEVGIGIVGMPWDGGTTNRPGARHGPRALRDASTMVRAVHPVSRINPYRLCNCADMEDCVVNPASVQDTLRRAQEFIAALAAKNIRPLVAGGDHLCSLPVLRALSARLGGPLGMVHFDAHTDLFFEYFGGERYTHGTPFRRAIEEGLLDPERVAQIGVRGTMYDGEDIEFGRAAGVRIYMIEEVFERGVPEVMAEVRERIGAREVYVSFDIDAVDPAFAPGTGTPEIGGFNTFQAQQLVRGLDGLNVVGADLVEVSPPFDPAGGTAWVGASLMFELLCVLARARGEARDASG